MLIKSFASGSNETSFAPWDKLIIMILESSRESSRDPQDVSGVMFFSVILLITRVNAKQYYLLLQLALKNSVSVT